MLQQLHPDVYTIAVPHRMLFFHFGARMTVVRLEGGKLLLHSPVPLDGPLQDELSQLGTVAYIVAPNAFHHLHIGPYPAAFPDAALYGPKALAEKRPDLNFTGFFEDAERFPWSDEIDQESVQGAPNLSETVFLHKKSGTLIVCDLIFNIHHTPGLITRFYLWFFGIYKKPGVSKLIKLLTEEKGDFTQSIKRIKQWHFERIVPAHGEVIETKAKQALEDCY
ncbi:MAG: DUF4336 domain-containing protein [Acidobacteriota bacterium]|nr:DUF4336 domain-containing protein [Acidobacteriota bacterium]